MKPGYLLLLCFLLPACEAPVAANTLVYIDNSAIQCEFRGKPPAETAALLEDAGVTVQESFCAYRTGMAIAAMCGTGDLNINVHRISESDLALAGELGLKPAADLGRNGDQGYAQADCPE